eukprot:gene13363-19208_t
MVDNYSEDGSADSRLPTLDKPSTAPEGGTRGYREAIELASSPKPVPKSVRQKQAANAARAGTAPVGRSNRSSWPVPQSQGPLISPLMQLQPPPRAKFGIIQQAGQVTHVRPGWIERDGVQIPVQSGVTVVDAFSHDIVEGPMAIRIMQKLRQLEEHMRRHPGGGGGGGKGGMPSSEIDRMSSRIMGLEARLEESENARVENLIARLDKSVKEARMDFEGDGGVGRKQLKEAGATSAAALAASEKLKSSMAEVSARLAKVESNASKASHATTSMDSQIKGASAELEELGGKVHGMDMVLQQWTRGFVSGSSGRSSEVAPAPVPAPGADKQAKAVQNGTPAASVSTIGAPPMVVDLQERMSRMEEAHASLAAQLAEVSEEADGRVAELSLKMEDAAASEPPKASTDEVDALAQELERVKEATVKLEASLEARLAESSAASSALLEELKGQVSGTSTSVTELTEKVASLEQHDAGTVPLAKAEVEALLAKSIEANKKTVIDLKEKLAPLMDELVNRIKKVEAKAPVAASGAKSEEVEALGTQLKALESGLGTQLKTLESGLGSYARAEAVSDLARKIEELSSAAAAAQAKPIADVSPAAPAEAAAASAPSGEGGALTKYEVDASIDSLARQVNERVTVLQTKVTNLLQVLVGRVKALETGAPPSSVPAGNGSGSLDEFSLEGPTYLQLSHARGFLTHDRGR